MGCVRGEQTYMLLTVMPTKKGRGAYIDAILGLRQIFNENTEWKAKETSKNAKIQRLRILQRIVISLAGPKPRVRVTKDKRLCKFSY